VLFSVWQSYNVSFIVHIPKGICELLELGISMLLSVIDFCILYRCYGILVILIPKSGLPEVKSSKLSLERDVKALN
jgi:hypothetical protein